MQIDAVYIGEWMKGGSKDYLKPCKITIGQAQQTELAPIFQYELCVIHHLLVDMDAFARGPNLHWYTN